MNRGSTASEMADFLTHLIKHGLIHKYRVNIVDFYAPAVRLVIELDGSQHYESEEIEKDLSRDANLHALNIHVLRFDNYQVKKYSNNVLEEIYRYIDEHLNEINAAILRILLALRASPFFKGRTFVASRPILS